MLAWEDVRRRPGLLSHHCTWCSLLSGSEHRGHCSPWAHLSFRTPFDDAILGMPSSKSVARWLFDIRWVGDFDLRLEAL